ncbi:MAG: UDP-N-acetylglucosamine--N-acetylmuramyl-(pentapeptide) pyrophosphoryl-undecaprenol N-acetylglucosamine transferase, partial [Ignavibacteriota bacterium]
MKQKTIVIASGGTGGHLYPTIAVAEEIRVIDPEIRVVFVGTSNRIESKEVPRAGFEFRPIEISAPGRSFNQLIKFPLQYQKAYLLSQKILRELGPSAFLGGGAYLSVPVAFAAKRKRIPISLLEINAVAGRANKLLSKSAERIFLSYPETKSEFPNVEASKLKIVGTPVRNSLEIGLPDRQTALEYFGLKQDHKTLLVFGGSLGARSLNEAMIQSAQKLLDTGMNIIWQTGASADVEGTEELLEERDG